MTRLDSITGLKMCFRCKKDKPARDFGRRLDRPGGDGLQSWCKECHNARHIEDYNNNPEKFRIRVTQRRAANPEKGMLIAARSRAKINNTSCSITLNDISIPACCPICQRQLIRGTGKGGMSDFSPSLDKFNPRLGYVPGNVWVICQGCNRRKGDMSGEELIAFGLRIIDAFKGVS